jgi:hypothetical protein
MSEDDVILLVGGASGWSVLGLSAQINFTAVEAASDRVVINALASDDVGEDSGGLASAFN